MPPWESPVSALSHPGYGREDSSPAGGQLVSPPSSLRAHRVVTCCDTSWCHIQLRGARQVSPVTVKLLKLLRRSSRSVMTRRESHSLTASQASVNGRQGGGSAACGLGVGRARASCVPQLKLGLGLGCGQPVTIIRQWRGGGNGQHPLHSRTWGVPSTRCSSSPPDEERLMGRMAGVPEQPT